MVKKRFTILIFLIFIFFLLTITKIKALIISPPYINIDYEPGKTYNWGFNVGGIKEENVIAYFSVYTTGELNQSIKVLTNQTIALSAGKWAQIGGTLTLPSKLKPGINRNGVVVVQVPDKDGYSNLAALIGVEYVINVVVPYPGKYLEVSLDVQSVKVNEPVIFAIKLINRGSQTINKADVILEIYNADNNKITDFNEKVENIDIGETSTLLIDWQSKGQKYGIYKAIAIINYDGETETIEKSFRLGDLIIDIINITGNVINKGDVGKMGVVAESQSNDFIDNAYAIVEIETNKGILQLKSPSLNFDPFTTREFNVFLETSNLDVGIYDAKAKVFYADKIAGKSFSIIIKRDIFRSILTTQNLIMLLIIILLIILLLNFIKFRRYKKDSR